MPTYQTIQIDPDRPFYHGTDAPRFQQVRPRTSVTTDLNTAHTFSQGKEYSGGQENRVIELRLGMAEVPVIPMRDDLFDPDHESGDPFAPYHEFAAAEARRLGYDGYVTTLFPHSERMIGELVLLDPDKARIRSHDIDNDSSFGDVVSFHDLPQAPDAARGLKSAINDYKESVGTPKPPDYSTGRGMVVDTGGSTATKARGRPVKGGRGRVEQRKLRR